MDYATYKKLKEDIEREYRKRLEALELLWKDYRPTASSDKKSVSSTGSGKLTDAIRTVIDGLGAQFTADEVGKGLEDILGKGSFNRLQITNTLHRLYRKKEIEITEKGRGRAPSRYGKITATKAQVV